MEVLKDSIAVLHATALKCSQCGVQSIREVWDKCLGIIFKCSSMAECGDKCYFVLSIFLPDIE